MEKNNKNGSKLLNEETLSVLDAVQEGVAVVDKGGKIVFINQKIVDLWGYSKKEFQGKRFQILKVLSPESFAKVLPAFTKRILGRENPRYEIEIRTKDGQKRLVEVQASSLRKGNKVVGIVATLTDRTEHKLAERELKKRNEELEKFYKIAVGRELKISELKKRISELERELKN